MLGHAEYKIYADLMEKANNLSKMGFEQEANYWWNKANDAFYDYEEACRPDEFAETDEFTHA